MPDVREYGLSRPYVEELRRRGKALVITGGSCAGCGEKSQEVLESVTGENYPQLPTTNSRIPLCRACKPKGPVFYDPAA